MATSPSSSTTSGAGGGAGGGGGGGGGTTEPSPPSTPELKTSIEAEHFSTKSTGKEYNNDSWSNKKGWNIYTDGYIEHTIYVDNSQSYIATIYAKGDLVAGQPPPRMLLHINGVVRAERDVNSESRLAYLARVTLPRGDVKIKIEFKGDYNEPDGDKNLKVDIIHLESTPRREWSQEAETFPTWTAGSQSSDPAASGGAAWNVKTNGSGQTSFTTRITAAHEVRIVAKGDPKDGVWPLMQVFVDSAKVGEWSVDADVYKTYNATAVTLQPGSHTIAVHYVNDDVSETDDRNLFVDLASVTINPAVWAQEAETFPTIANGKKSNRSFASAGAEELVGEWFHGNNVVLAHHEGLRRRGARRRMARGLTESPDLRCDRQSQPRQLHVVHQLHERPAHQYGRQEPTHRCGGALGRTGTRVGEGDRNVHLQQGRGGRRHCSVRREGVEPLE